MFALVPSPESDPYIQLVNLQSGYPVARFKKKHLAIALGTPKVQDCPQCKERPVIVLAR